MAKFTLLDDEQQAKKGKFTLLDDASGDKLVLASQDGGFEGSKLGGLVRGGRDILEGAAQIAGKVAPKVGLKGIAKALEGIDQHISTGEAEYQAARQAAGRGEGTDWMRVLGNVLGTAPIAAAKPLQLANGKGLFDLGNMLRGAGQSVAIGGLQPVTQGDFKEEKLKQIGTSAAFGIGAAPAGAAVNRFINPQIAPEVQALQKEGVRLTPGQIFGGSLQRAEDKLKSLPGVGDFMVGAQKRGVEDLNRAAYSRALVGTGVDANKLPVGREGIAAVKDAVSKQYDDLLPKLVWKPDEQFSQEVKKIAQMSSGMGAREQRRFIADINNIMSKTKNGVMLGETYKTVESKLSRDAKNFLSSPDAYQKEMGAALTSVLESMKSTLERSNPSLAKELAQANSNYANYVRLREAGKSAADQSGGFSPAQLSAAVKATDKSVGKGQFATGKALMQDLSDAAVSRLSSKYPDSGTTGRALLAGGLGAGAYANPLLLIAGGAASLPYTKSGQKIISALMTQRPKGAKEVGNALLRISPVTGAALSSDR